MQKKKFKNEISNSKVKHYVDMLPPYILATITGAHIHSKCRNTDREKQHNRNSLKLFVFGQRALSVTAGWGWEMSSSVFDLTWSSVMTHL